MLIGIKTQSNGGKKVKINYVIFLHTLVFFFFLLEIHICYIQFIYNQYLLVSWMTVICQEFINYIILTIWKDITNKILFLKTHSTI